MASGKAKNRRIDQFYLDGRSEGLATAGFPKSKWIGFCETMLDRGYEVFLYEAKKTVSKYVTVVNPYSGHRFKVRFSNHKPIKERERNNDCDFFVGRTNFRVTTTADAIKATIAHLSKTVAEPPANDNLEEFV